MPPGREGFEEVMIVNPYDPRTGLQGASTMMYPSAFGYFHQPPEAAYGYGYGYPAPAGYGYYAWPFAETDELADYAEDDPYGEADEYGETDEYGEADEYGDYAEDDPYGFYAEDDPYGEYADDDLAEADEYGAFAEAGPEMVGYGEDELGEYDPSLGAYVRDMDPAFNAGCPMPTNLAAYGEADDYAGYVRPGTVNARVQSFTPQPGATPGVPPTFAPLW
jgi:hypothetical protein